MPERLEIEIHRGAIEHAQHDALAKLRRQRRDAQIDRAARDILLDAPVLRQAALGDVHVRHHLNARDDRQREVPRRRRHFVERAVHAVADFEFVLERLEMNVARPVLDRLVQDQIDEANDRRGVRFGFDIRDRRFVAVECHQLASLAELLEDLLHAGGLVAVMLFQAFLDLLARGKHHLDVAAQREAQIVDRLCIERIDQRDPDGVLLHAHWQGAVQAGQPCGNRTQNFGSEFDCIEIDHFRPERVGDDPVELRFVHNPMIDHRLVDRFPILRRLEKTSSAWARSITPWSMKKSARRSLFIR